MSVRTTVLGTMLLIAAAGLAAGCGKFKKGPTQGELYAAVAASPPDPDDPKGRPKDADQDGLPDDVERRYQAVLGTDPANGDGDGDGVPDGVEVLGRSWLYRRAESKAGALAADAPALRADDPAQPHEASRTDTDGDGVPDWLEVEGYEYDWREAAFVHAPGSFHTDPLQWSTDQDAYSDGTEVSGINMDVAVRSPGDHPLVPAYPDIVVEAVGYAVTLNEQVTYSRGGQLEKGFSWSRETRTEHSSGSETGFGVEAGFELGAETKFSFGASFNQSWTSTDTRSEAVTTGGSVTEQVNWDRARSFNSVDAARVKLFVRVHNRGTAPASNLVPTISIRIGGAQVATFEAADLPIHMLLPGASYPPDQATSLVLDRDGQGAPLSLTDWELRALESGAPITLSVAQKRADVMRLGAAGGWERVGDVNEYLARILAVSASLAIDLGHEPTADPEAPRPARRPAGRLVYAGRGPAAPEVTLADALRWTDGFEDDGAGSYSLQYRRDDGLEETVLLEGSARDDRTWRCQADPVTVDFNWPFGAAPRSVAEVLGLRLLPGSQVSLRAPRPDEAELPLIHSAYALPTEEGHEVVVCASDYDAVARVVFVDKDRREHVLTRDGRGPWFFATTLEGYTFSATKEEQVRVESQRTAELDGQQVPISATRHVELVYTPAAAAPIVRRVSYDNASGRFYARVEPGGPEQADQIDWVKLFHPGFEAAAGERGGVLELGKPINEFEDPYGWDVVLPEGWLSDMTLVAHTGGGRYTKYPVGKAVDLLPYATGSAWLSAHWDYTATDYWRIPQIDLEGAAPACPALEVNFFAWAMCVAADPRIWSFETESDEFDGQWPANGPQRIWDEWKTHKSGADLPDLYVRSVQYDWSQFVLGLHSGGIRVETSELDGLPSSDWYEAATRDTVLSKRAGRFTLGHAAGGTTEPFFFYQEGTVFLLLTDQGRVGKAIVRGVSDNSSWWGDWWTQTVNLDFRIFREPSDYRPPVGLAYPAVDAVYAVGTPIARNFPTWSSTGDPPLSWRLCAASGTPCLDEDPGLLPAGLAFDPASGGLTGTPTAAFGPAVRTVYGLNDAGQAETTLRLTVLRPPRDLVYTPSAKVCETGWYCQGPVASVQGDVARFDAVRRLPDGLQVNQGTGQVTGTPTIVTAAADYQVTAANEAGSSTTGTVRLETVLGRIADVMFPGAPFTFTAGTPIPDVVPTHVGGAVETWSVEPALPAGLTLDFQTGRLWGTPGGASAEAAYRITATNARGSASATVTITVRAAP